MQTENFKKKLLEEKEVLVKELGTMGVFDKETNDWEASPTLKGEQLVSESDENDAADRALLYEERTATLNTLEKRFQAVEKALAKIEANTYGVCEVCGKAIDEKRLEANPAAATCTEHMN